MISFHHSPLLPFFLGRCGCCWAISLAGAIEGAAFANNGYLQSVSFQQFISCNDINWGCDGGNLIRGVLYATLNEYDGMTRLNDYEYSDYHGTTTEECLLETNKYPLAVEVMDPRLVVGFDTPVTFEERLQLFKQALAEKPVAMVIRSSCKTLSNYRSGVLTDDGDCACSDSSCIDHAVLMVGYDDTAPIPYFKIKNSWSDGWGEDGYFPVAQTEIGDYGLFECWPKEWWRKHKMSRYKRQMRNSQLPLMNGGSFYSLSW